MLLEENVPKYRAKFIRILFHNVELFFTNISFFDWKIIVIHSILKQNILLVSSNYGDIPKFQLEIEWIEFKLIYGGIITFWFYHN